MLPIGSFLALIVIPSASDGHLAHDVGDVAVALALLALADEPGVLGEAARVEEQRLAVAVAERADRAQVGQRHGLAAAAVVRDRDHHARDVVAALAQQRSSAATSMLPLNGWSRRGSRPSAMTRSTRLGAGGLDVRAGRVEVGVVRDDLARPADAR